MRTAGIGYASYFFTLQRIRKKLPVAGSVDEKCTKDRSVEDSVHVWKSILAHTINVHYND